MALHGILTMKTLTLLLLSTLSGLAQITPFPSGGGSGGGSVFTGSTAVTSTFSATPTFSLADVTVKSPVRFEPGAMTANVTAVTFTNKTAGAKFSISWLQDATGSRTVADGGINTCPVVPDANASTVKEYEVAADGTTVYVVGCATSASAGMLALGSTPPTAPSGYLRTAGVTADLNFEITNSAGNTYGTVNGQNCGTTSTCAHTANSALRVAYGSAPLVSGTPSTVTITALTPAFTSASTYLCTLGSQAAAATALLSVSNVSGSSFTITGPNTVTTVINYMCVGN